MRTSRPCIALALALVGPTLAIAQQLAPAALRLTQPATPSPSAGPSVAWTALAVAQPTRLDPVDFARHASDQAAHISRREWDVDARAEALGPGVEPAFTYVRDAIRYEAYAGVLRGAAGTYTARAGNAVDRAQLLAELLASKNVRTQFAFGTLDAAQRDRLWQRTFDASIPLAPALADGSGPTTAGKSFRQRIAARATRDFGVVRAALGDRLPPVTSPTREQVLAEMNPHVWVQAEVDGRWIDLDPSFADGKLGTPVTAAERFAAELPAELFQRVSIRLVLEQLQDGKLVSTTLLDLSRHAVDLVDQQIFVVHSPGKPIAMAGLGAAMGGYATWTPALWLDGHFAWGTTFTIDERGGIAAPVADATAAPKPRGGGVLDVLDALAADPDSSASAGNADGGAVFVAEWLEFELTSPGGAREITRRVLAERGGSAWRARLPLEQKKLNALQRDADGPIAMRAVHNVWFSAGPHNLADYADAMEDLALAALALAAGEPPQEAEDFGASMWPVALQNFSWMVWTDHAIVPRLNDTPGVRVYADRPRIAIFTIGPDSSDGSMMMSDLRRDDLRAIAAAPAQGAVLADKKLWFALLQGALEHEGIAEVMVALGVDPATVETTSSRLAADGVVVLTPGSALPATGRPPDAESAARLVAALGAGAIVVAPMSGLDARGAWWEITPGIGAVSAIGELGLHSGRGGIPGKNDPFKRGKSPQQNDYGGQRGNHTPESRKEAEKAIRDKRAARQTENAKRDHAKRQNNLKKSSKRGSSEYTVLTTAIMIAGAAAYSAFFYYLGTQVMSTIDALSPE